MNCPSLTNVTQTQNEPPILKKKKEKEEMEFWRHFGTSLQEYGARGPAENLVPGVFGVPESDGDNEISIEDGIVGENANSRPIIYSNYATAPYYDIIGQHNGKP